MTSLQKQLRDLAQQEHQTGLKKPSLLFTQKEAAALDLDDIYDIGVNGLLELIQMDEKFATFQSTILSPQARRIDREGQTAEQNEALDELLRDCLMALSPFFMLRPAHKVLEWLLRRFSVHRYNVVDVMCCLLPFHDTATAARLVQLVSIEGTIFSFFEGVRKTGSPMPRAVLVERCLFSPPLLPLIFDAVSRSVARGYHNRPLYSLFASLCVGLVRFRPTEEAVRLVMSVAVEGINSRDLNVVAASKMAFAQICASVQLEGDALTLLASAFSDDLQGLALLLQTQADAVLSPKIATFVLESSEELVKLAKSVDVGPLVAAVLDVLAEPELENASSLLNAWSTACTHVVPLLSSKRTLDYVCSVVLGCARSLRAPSRDFLKRLAGIMNSLGPDAGLGVAHAFQEASDDPELASRIERVGIDIFGAVSAHSPLPGSGTTLLLSLTHRDPRVRLSGVTVVDREIRANRLALDSILATSVCALASDSDLQVAETVLLLPWFRQALANDPTRLWDTLEPCLGNRDTDSRLVKAALVVALDAQLKQSIPCATRLCVINMNITNNGPSPFYPVLTACAEAVERGCDNRLIVHLAKSCGTVTLRNSEGSASKKKQKHAEEQKVDGIRGLVASIVDAVKADFENVWPVVADNLELHTLLLVCISLLRGGVDEKGLVTRKATSLISTSKNVPWSFKFPESLELSDWTARWESDINQVYADVTVCLVTQGSLSSEEDSKAVFSLLTCFLDDSSSVLLKKFLQRLPQSPVSFLCHRFSEDSIVVSLRALHVMEAACQSASSSALSENGSFWLASLLVPLLRPESRLRRAGLRCVARLVKRDLKSNAFVAALVKSIDAASSEIKHSSDAVLGAVKDQATGGASAIRWCSKLLNDTRVKRSVRVAVLRAVRQVVDTERIESFFAVLKLALKEGDVDIATTLLDGLIGCASSIGRHEPTIELLVEAIQSPIEAVALSALHVVVPELWNGLAPSGKRVLLSALCQAGALGVGEVPTVVAQVAREIGAVKGSDVVAAELHLSLSSVSGTKKARSGIDKDRLLSELARLEVVLELLRASRGGDATTAVALLQLLSELALIAGSTDASRLDFTVQLVLSVLAPLVESHTARLDESSVDILLRCLYANHSTHVRNAVLALLSAGADTDPLPVARQIMQLFRADGSTVVAVDNKASFRVMRTLLERVLPHLSAAHCEYVLGVFIKALPSIPPHRQQLLLESAAKGLPGKPLGRILISLLDRADNQLPEDQARTLAGSLCGELGAVASAEALVEYLKHTGVAGAQFVADMFNSDAFINSCVVLSSEEDQSAVQNSLSLVFYELLAGLENSPSVAVHDAIDAINELFTIPHFLKVVHQLLRHSNHEARVRATVVLNERVTAHRKIGLTEIEEKAFVSLLPELVQMLNSSRKDERVLQAALLSMDILGRNFASTHPTPIVAALRAVLDLASSELKAKQLRQDLCASSLLTVSALSSQLGPGALPLLGDCLKVFLLVLSLGEMSEELNFSALSGLFEMVLSLGSFMAPFAESLLAGVLATKIVESAKLVDRARSVAESLAKTLAPRLLITPLEKLVVSQPPITAVEVIKIVGTASQQTSRPADLRQLWNVCIIAATPRDEAVPEEVSLAAAENAAEVAFHLSETDFRPLFLQVVETCTNSRDPKVLGPLFSIGTALLKKLRSLAVPWGVKLNQSLITALGIPCDSMDVVFAIRNALTLLHQLFYFDGDRIINKDVHTNLIDPLVNCFEIGQVRELVAPAVLEMAASMGSDALWKPLNFAILLKLRSRDPHVQSACLATLLQLWKRFGEDWLVLLPDTMPFLGEILEDENDDVMRHGQELLKLVNSFLPNAISFD